MSAETTDHVDDVGEGYLAESRSFALSIISILPLVILYHWGIVKSDSPVRNAAQAWLDGPLRLVGLEAAHLLNIALILALGAVLWRSRTTRAVNLLIVVAMVGEAAFYAALLFKGGPAIAGLVDERTSGVVFAAGFRLSPARGTSLMLGLGAGVYEELVFRLGLIGGGTWVLRRVCRWSRAWSVVATVVVSSVLFALAHNVGPLGEDLDRYSFVFRTVCGALLGAVFLVRGLGVAVWTHSIYNALVILQASGQYG